MSKAFFGGGCFWCLDAIFRELKGVEKVISGYMGGHVTDPTYEQVCSGDTGHAEIIKICYQENLINYETLLEIFFSAHDPTTIDRQGHDIGSQYRSVIFYENHEEKTTVHKVIDEFLAKKVFPSPIVTEVLPVDSFYKAENYHQNYLFNNDSHPYCQAVINPKLDKFRRQWTSFLKESE